MEGGFPFLNQNILLPLCACTLDSGWQTSQGLGFSSSELQDQQGRYEILSDHDFSQVQKDTSSPGYGASEAVPHKFKCQYLTTFKGPADYDNE